MYSETRVCIICRKTFEAHNPNQRLCSEKCISIRSAAQQRKYYAREAKHKTKPIYSKPKAEEKPILAPSASIVVIAWKAKKAGMSYGHYVATH